MATAEPQATPSPEDLRDSLLLTLVSGIGPRLRKNLLAVFGSPQQVLDARRSQLEAVPGIGPKLAKAVAEARSAIDLDAELDRVAEHGARLLFDTDIAYPPMLREIEDPPALLYLRGTIEPSDSFAVAMVGTRHATRYGEAQARRLASELAAAGVTVVSGLARGIDTEAHRGALAAGGRTLAVLGGGLAKFYPPENRKLAAEITQAGAVMSEFSMATTPNQGTFPQRNRVISGLSLGVVVIEAPPKSGSLITAQMALEQGREVFALPGPVDSAVSRGCHQLIRDGAKLIESADDILEELGRPTIAIAESSAEPEPLPPPVDLDPGEAAVLAAVPKNPTLMDDILATSGLPAAQVLGLITLLELKGLVRRAEGNRWQRLR
jgi:DNA processing protein